MRLKDEEIKECNLIIVILAHVHFDVLNKHRCLYYIRTNFTGNIGNSLQKNLNFCLLKIVK